VTMPKFKIFVTVVVICCPPVQLAMAHTVDFGTQTSALAPYGGGVNGFDSVPTPTTRSYDFDPPTDNPNAEQNAKVAPELGSSPAPTAAPTPTPNSMMIMLHQWFGY
jgi:hypothetical protein